MIEVFYSKLQDVLSEEASKVIFANIDDILLFNTVCEHLLFATLAQCSYMFIH